MAKAYDPRIQRYLNEIERTPTGRPLIEWVKRHQPTIEFGQPVTGGAFTYPWPINKIVIKDDYGEEWQRETVAHELAHMIRWYGHFVGSLEQEYDAYTVGAKVRCEHAGVDWRDPHSPAAKWFPELFAPGASPAAFMASLRSRDPFYAVLPWLQPRTPWSVAFALGRQAWFAIANFLKKQGLVPSHGHDHHGEV